MHAPNVSNWEPSHYVASLLEEKFLQFNTPDFIPDDPVSIPHLFSKKQDIEIAGFFAAILAWGQRKTIISKCKDLLSRMDNAPYDFVLHHQESDLQALESFKHRTFNGTDTLYFIDFFKRHYQQYSSLEDAFLIGMSPADETVEKGLIGFDNYFADSEYFPNRTRKHVASPARGSSCKRINMFLRWMVRQDDKGVDFGIWDRLSMRQLICPCDVHVERVARHLGLVTVPQTNWKMAIELTQNLKKLDANDPVKFDFALFGLGVIGEL